MTEKFDQKLTNKILPRFATAKEWPDLMTILKKFKENLVKYKSSNMSILTDKISLAKRLAQCLNQNLPSGVHEIDLDIYSMLFENIKQNNNNFMGDNLGLYSAGLFPFFIYASAQNKIKFLNDIIKKHYLTLEISEFKLSLSGILASILPALEEQNEVMQKIIREVFLSAREKCGDEYFFGTLWSIVFRNKKLRIDCIKYINEVVPPYNEIILDENQREKSDLNINEKIDNDNEEIEENNDENEDNKNNIDNDKEKVDNKNVKNKKNKYTINQVIEKFYPNLSVLILNSLQELIVNSDLYTQRIVMDFIITHFPIENNILSEDEKISLITSALKLLIKNEHSATRRLLIWLMGQNQDEEVEMGEPNIQYMLVLLVKSLKLMLKNEKNREDLLNDIKIIDHLLKQQVKFVDYILEPISIEIILVVQDYWDNYSKQEAKDEVIQKIKNFYVYDSGYLDLLWNSLGKRLNSMNKNILILANNSNNINKALQEFNSILKVLNFCLEFIYLDKINSKIKYYIPIVSSLLKSFPIFKIENINDLDTIEPFLELTLKIVKSLQLGFNSKEEEENSLYGENLRNNSAYYLNNENDNEQYNDEIFNEFLKNQIKFTSKRGNSLQYIIREGQQNSNIIQLFAENILSFQQKTYIQICKVILESEKKIWEKLKEKDIEEENNLYEDENEINYEHIKIFKYSTELAILTQEYINASNYNFNFISNTIDIPEWILFLERIIFSYNIDLSLEAINYLLDLFMVSSENIVYDNIKSYLRTEDIDESLINKELLKELLNQTHVSKNCLELSMSRLWGLIEDQSHQKPVADLLIKFFIADANIFQNTISNTFAVNDIETNVISIKNFSQFWKLTSEFYPDIIFFENGECIFKMLDFLEHEHPLIRHLSKSWLSEAKNQFRKIIDPLLKVLLDKETKWYISFQKQLFFTREYDNRRIIEAFRKLKNIIINVPEIAIGFFIKEKISQNLLEMDELGKELKNVTKTITLEFYLELLVTISLRFIQGKFIESVSEQFYRENFSVNAASCEFLEFLLSYVEPKNKVMDIAQSIVEPVLEIMMESLKNQDEVMQVQLINLLKVLLIGTSNIHDKYKEQVSIIVNDKMFQKCIVSGIQINYIFVRGYFINFIESCLPVFKNVLNLRQNLNLAKKLILTNTNFLVSRVKYNNFKKNENINNLNRIDNKDNEEEKYENYSSLYLDEGNRYFILKNYLKEYKDLKKLDENDILVIIKGLKNIIFHFLEIKEVPNKDIIDMNNLKQTSPENLPIDIPFNRRKNLKLLENFSSNINEEFNWENIKTIINSSSKTSLFSFFGLFSSSGNSSQSPPQEQTENSETKLNFGISQEEDNIPENANISNEDIIQKILDITEDIIASLVVCWINSSENEQLKDYCLNENGILSGDFDEMSFMENINNEKNTTNIQSVQLKQLIITILWNIYIKYPLAFMKNIIKLFMTEDHRYISKDKQYKLSIIEILSLMKIPTDIFILSISKTIDTDKLKSSEKTQNKFNGYYPYSLNKEQSTYEAKLCQLIYSYLIFGQFGISKINVKIDSKLCLDTWTEAINLINILFESKSPMTLFWLYEIINVLMYKFPIKELGISNYTKKQISNIIINIFNKIYELSINDYYEAVYASPTQIITPLPPSVYQAISYELYTDKISKIQTMAESLKRNKKNNLRKIKKIEKPENINKTKINIMNIEKEINANDINKNCKDALRNFYENMNNYIQNKQILETDKLIVIYRNIGFICLSSLFYSNMKTLFTINKMMPHFILVINGLLTLIKKYRNIKGEINLENEIYVDLSTKFLYNLMNQASMLTYNSSKDKIMEFYLNPDFFCMSPKNLILWKDIISKFAQSYNDIINDLISRINQGGGIFFNRNTDQQNIIAMRRLSFILYSSPKNMYSLKLGQIMEKAKEVITKYSENPTLLSEIFLMIRVMFLRFSNENLIELIRALWPIIFSELVSILTGKRKNINNELNLGCAKLVELLTISNMEEFCLYQWIFFIDSYNVEDVDIRNNDNKYQLYYLLNTQNNCFKPFAFSMAKNWNKCMDFLMDFNSRHYELFQKRSLTLQVQKIINEDELGSLIAKMFTYVAIMNNFRDILDLDSVEHVIENDFLSYTDNNA